MSNQRLLNALWVVRAWEPDAYQRGLNVGVAIGKASQLPYEQMRRINNLITNAAEYARRDAKKEQRK